jgi:ATP-dependent Lon protease
MPDGGTTIIIQGKKRFTIEEITSNDPYFKARVTLLEEDVIPQDEDFSAYISNIKDLAGQIVSMSPNLPTEASII